MIISRCRLLFVLILILSVYSSLGADDRWDAYLKEDMSQIRGNLNTKILLLSGGFITSMYLLSHFDEDLNVSVKSINHGAWKKYFDAIDYLGYVPYTGPISIGIAGMTMLSRDKKLQDAAFSSVEAVVFNTLATTVVKLLIGRGRPDADAGAHTFAPFTDLDSSFPSGHASTAFAFITPWVVYYPKPYTYLLLIFPASTAISRMMLNRHWFTDVLTGSVLGALIGYNLAKWHKDLARKNNYYGTHETGLLISLSIPIR